MIGRKVLHHDVPFGASENPEFEVYFITICCRVRGANQLAEEDVWQLIDETLSEREATGAVRVGMVLAMPDHLHGLFSFHGGVSMKGVIEPFKRWVSRKAGIDWQRGFFDHRLRSHESAAEKRRYIRMNPVRAGLVSTPEEWKYCR